MSPCKNGEILLCTMVRIDFFRSVDPKCRQISTTLSPGEKKNSPILILHFTRNCVLGIVVYSADTLSGVCVLRLRVEGGKREKQKNSIELAHYVSGRWKPILNQIEPYCAPISRLTPFRQKIMENLS